MPVARNLYPLSFNYYSYSYSLFPNFYFYYSLLKKRICLSNSLTTNSTCHLRYYTNTNTNANTQYTMSSATDRLSNFGLGASGGAPTEWSKSDADAPKNKFRIGVVGSGNWSSALSKHLATNVLENPDLFEREVKMWVYEEQIDGKNLTEIINTKHENVKYLPGIQLPENLVAEPDLLKAAEGADLLVFNLPHQFLPKICDQLKKLDLQGVRAISCLKGLEVNKNGVFLLSDYIKNTLGVHCGVLSGANLAPEVAKELYSETTIAYDKPEDYFEGDIDAKVLRTLFERPFFHVRISSDTAGVSIGGAIKNVVALGAGFVEGMGWGDNAKSAIMRRGLLEMIKFSATFFPSSKPETLTEESAGVADLITSCAGGRNVRVGVEMAKTDKPIEQIEKELLNGQSAQGLVTAKEVHELLTARGMTDDFPLLTACYKISFEGMKIEDLPEYLRDN